MAKKITQVGQRTKDAVEKVEQSLFTDSLVPKESAGAVREKPFIRVRLLDDLSFGDSVDAQVTLPSVDPSTGEISFVDASWTRKVYGVSPGITLLKDTIQVCTHLPKLGYVPVESSGGEGGSTGGFGGSGTCDCFSDFGGAQVTTHCTEALDAWRFNVPLVMDSIGCSYTTGNVAVVNFDPGSPNIYSSGTLLDCGYETAVWKLDLSAGLMPGQVELRLEHSDPGIDVRYRNAYYWRCTGRNLMIPIKNELLSPTTLCEICLQASSVEEDCTCKNDINPAAWEVTIAGVTTKTGTCIDNPQNYRGDANCEELNATWILEFVGKVDGNCSWASSEVVSCGTFGDIVRVRLTSSGTSELTLSISDACNCLDFVRYRKTITPVDCTISHELAFSTGADQIDPAEDVCEGWPATLTVSPLF